MAVEHVARPPRTTRRRLGALVAGAATGAAALLGPGAPAGASGVNRDPVAQCESARRQTAGDVNGQRVGAGPFCGRRDGSSKHYSSGSDSRNRKSYQTTEKKRSARGDRSATRAPRRAAPASSGATYTVRPGDSLSRIAEVKHVAGGWPALYARNRHVVGDNPSLIFPGQRLRLR